jgi:predicted short-subunit dehydrogenase-like oxidoreductase (DUF2520 family)
MAPDVSILGRGQAGRALAAAWGKRARLCSHLERPEGLVLLAVPDRAIAGLAAEFPGRCVHMSGSLHLANVPCAHPLTSFTGEAADWRGTPLAVTGAVPASMLRAFESLGFLPFQLPPERKALYHACAVLTSGHAATLWLEAHRLLAEAGVVLPGRGLIPLAEATVRNVAEKGEGGRTGPFVRGDEATITQDAAALPEPWRDLFLRLGRLAGAGTPSGDDLKG